MFSIIEDSSYEVPRTKHFDHQATTRLEFFCSFFLVQHRNDP